MFRTLHFLGCIAAVSLAVSTVQAQSELRATLFVQADKALETARAANAELLAPGTFGRGLEAYSSAENDLTRGRNIERIRSSLDTATKAFTDATNAAEIANVTLAALIKTRADAMNADAGTFATELWAEAGERFDSAARRLESGKTSNADKQTN